MAVHYSEAQRPGTASATWGASEFDTLLADYRRTEQEAAQACEMAPTARELLPLLLSLSRLAAQLHAREMFE